MRGQTSHAILDPALQRTLRKRQTEAESALWRHLRRRQLRGCKFRRQHPFEDYVLDFVCLERRVVVEADGGQHVESARDLARDRTLEAAGFTVLRFWNNDILGRIEDVLERIVRALEEAAEAEPSPPRPSP
jgi:very-short-patch-repair endonuclease